ncbi:TlpA family protein disulfide reductase [Chondrinema litorale]|uniref:TlpA family protein disulfide reductase n=1 Tax=Chondrinema litorale TaxID=2994555 RepID=UPI002542D6EA|nr:TlpA disulfide reductase family protein [Chondrinema litorale]UZR98233.1 TlpA disulfide reductase family protein [Chondrinema litorale]
MKTSILTSLLILLSLAAHSSPILTIEFDDIKSGNIFLINVQKELADTLSIKNGKVTYEAKIAAPTFFYLIVDGYNNTRPLELVLSSQLTEMNFESYKVVGENTVDEAYPNNPIFISDPNNNIAFFEFLSSWKSFYNTIQALSENNSEEQLEKRKNTYHTFLSDNKQIIEKNSDKYVSANIIDFLLSNNLLQFETLQTYYDLLSTKVKESYLGFKIGEKSGKAGYFQPGKPAPEITLVDMQGKKYNLQSLKGKSVLLHFWSSSCAPCIKEAPDLLKLQQGNTENLVVINFSLDTDDSKWKKGIERAGIEEMINVCDLQAYNSVTAKSFDVTFIPVYYLIDANGNISLKGTLRQITEKIKENMP